MTDTREMVDSSGGQATATVTAAIDALRDCEQTSDACAMAMVAVGGMVAEVRRDLDCADTCQALHRVLSRGPATDSRLVRALVDACQLACTASATACAAHAGHHQHCRLHAASAGACAVALRSLRAALGPDGT